MPNNLASIAPGLEGVAFTVAEGFSLRNCIVLQQALYLLSEDAEPQDLMAIYRRHEYRIQQVARRLLNAGQTDMPLVIGPWAFRPPSA